MRGENKHTNIKYQCQLKITEDDIEEKMFCNMGILDILFIFFNNLVVSVKKSLKIPILPYLVFQIKYTTQRITEIPLSKLSEYC